jgi:hypothetical protein
MNVPGILKKIAPFISLGLSATGPLGAMAGNALTSALGAKPGSKVSDVISALSTTPPTPEQIAALQQMDENFKLQLATLKINSLEELEKMIEEDVANARQREVEMAKAGAKDNTPKALAACITLGFFVTLWVVFIHGVPPATHDLAIGMVNVLGTAWVCVVSYYFGSSSGSDKKTQIIGDIAQS